MAKQLNVSLGFTADTSQAKAQLQGLQDQLQKLTLMSGTGPKLGFTKEIQEATTAAAQLHVQLKNATNVNTGTLDLGKFAESMNKSGMSLTKYQQQLRNLGPEGDKAFAQLAQSITNAEIPLKRASNLTTELWTTLKNTARWQLSSSLLHGFMGTLQSAYNYAQDLNESLNNIRIVTGASVEEMDAFALKANKAAQALSATTTEYTNAALIFYQQGLDDKEVEARTNATIKMAHAAGESATEVSSYMTAIWNNFAKDGTKSLEYYGDVMARLGADTAASSAEIAAGLQKFAGIGEVIGLEYEYATSAVATLVDKTREAPETVGTALKTIFARLQGLQMGETLEDGVDLNKYSKALRAVGIEVLDADGNMKTATNTIEELGAKWDELTNAQKTALAQTVAGTRQYTYFMSMFENFDSFKDNVEAAYDSTGTLEQQASIYAESWEAAQDRVTAAAEAIYGKLLDDEFFIDLSNFFADFLGVIDNTIDSLGGLKGVLLTIGTIVTQVFKKQIAESLGNLAYNIKMSTQGGRESLVKMKREANAKLVKDNFDQDTTSSRAAGLAYEAQGNAQMEYINNAERMSQEEQQISQHLLDRVRLMGELVAKSGEELEKAEDLSSELMRQAELKKKGSISSDTKNDIKDKGRNLGNILNTDKLIAGSMDKLTGSKDIKSQASTLKSLKETLTAVTTGYSKLGVEIQDAFGDDAAKKFTALQEKVSNIQIKVNADGTEEIVATEGQLKELREAWADWSKEISTSDGSFDNAFKDLIADMNLTDAQADALKQSLIGVGQAEGQLATQSGKLSAMGDGVKKFFMGAKGEAMSMSTAITQSASAVMSFGMTISSITGLIDTWKDSEASLTDKLIATTTTLGMVVPSVMSVIKGFQGAGQAVTIFGVQTSLAMWQVTLIVAAIAACIAIFALLFKAAQDKSLEHQMKKNQEAANDLKENLDAVKQEAEDLKETFNEYDTLVQTLDDCVKGTDEWRKALEDVNNCVLGLLDKYPQLAQYQDLYIRNAEGMLELNQDVVDKVLSDMEKTVDAATAASLLASADVAQDRAAIKSRDLKSDIGSYGAGTAHYTEGGGVYYDNYVQAGQIITENAEELANLTKEEYAEKVTELAQKAAEGMNMTDAQFEAMVADLIGYQDEVNALATATRNAANQMDNATLALANQALASQGYDAAETTMAAAGLGDEYESIYDEIIALSHKNSQADTNTDYSDEIWERFEAATGKTYDQADNTVQGNDDNRVYAYKDDSGKEQTFSEEYMAKTIAAYEAMQKLTDNAEAASDALSNMEDKVSNAEVSQGIKDWISTGSFENMTEADFNTMKSDVDSAGGTDAYLQEIFGMSADELAATFGEDYVTKFEESMSGFSEELGEVGGDLLEPVKQVFDEMDTSNLTLAGQKAVSDAMQAAFVNGGADGLAMVTSAMDGMEADDAEAFARTLNTMDWDSVDAATLSKTLKQAGVEADFTTEELKQLIDVMSDPRAIKDFDSLAEGYASLHEVADGLEFGDSISAEDFAVLGDEFESYFTRMADGTYKLTGDAEDFYEAVQGKSIEGFVENVDKLREQNAKLNAIKNFDFEDLTQSQLNAETNTYSGGDTKKQLQALEAVGYDAEQIAKWNEDLADGSTSVETLQAIADAVRGYKTELEQLDYQIAANEQAIFNQEVAIATSYTSLTDLKKAYDEGTISAEAFSVAAMQLHEAESMEGLDVEEMNDYADHLMEIAESSDMVSDELKDNEDAAEDVAKATMKLNRGIDKLADGFEDWEDVIKNSDESSQEFAEAMSGMKDAMSDVLGTSEEFISNDFIVENLEDIEKAATGDEAAIKRLQRALSDDILCQVTGVSDFSQLDTDLQDLQGRVWELSNQDIEVGATLNDGDFVTAAQELINNAGMTVDQAQAYFNSLGYEPEFVTEEQTVKRSIPQETTHTDYAITPGTLDIMGVEVPIPTVDRITTTRVTGYEELDEVIQVPALSADGTPQIKSLRRVNSGGSMSNYSSGNKGGGKPGGGGGGGGGGGKKEKKDTKKLTDEKERYHEITNTIEDMQHALDRVSAAKDRAFGKAKIAKINEEIAAYENLIAAQEQYLEEIERDYNTDRAALEGYGASIDENGNVDNYDELMASQIQRYNDAVAIYNASAQSEADKEAFQAAEDYYEAFLDALNQYEETHDLKKEAEATLEDQLNAKYDLELEKVDYQVNLQIDYSDEELEHLEYLLERIEAKGFSAAEAIANLGMQTQSLFNKNNAYKDGIMGIFGNHGLTKEDMEGWLAGDEDATKKVASLDLTEAEVEKLQEYTAGLRENNKALIEMRQTVHDKMLETFDEHNEKLDEGIAKLEHFKSMTESYKNIVDLVGKANIKDSDKAIKAINGAMVSQSKNIAESNIAKRDMIKADLEATKTAFAQQYDTISEEERKMWEDTIKTMEESLMEAEEEAMGSIEDWMEAINDQFIAEIEATMDRFSDAVAGKFKNLNELQDAFERRQSENDRYLEDYEKIYEFSKLNRDIEKSIDNTDNVHAKKELLALQEEINALEESGAEVSEYQIENLRKRYELKLAEQALEEAKDAKSQVRMTRDNEGNWGYTYTADESSVAEAEQSYEDKLYELQQHNADYINELQDSIINMQIEMKDKLAEIANDESLSIEERQAKMAEVQAYYQEQMGYYCSELELALGNNKKLYNEDWTDYSEKTGYKIAKDSEYVDSFHETDLAVLTGFENMESYQENFNNASENLLIESERAFDSWEVAMENALNAAGLSMENFADQVDKEMDKVKDDSQAVADKIKEDAGFMQGDYQEVINKVIEWENQYSQSIEAMIGESDRIIEKFNAVLALWGQVQTAANSPTPTPPTGGGNDGENTGGENNGGGGGGGKPSWDRVVAAYNKINQGKWGNGISNRISRGAADGFSEAEVRAGQELINYTYPTHLKGMGKSREEAKKLMGYDTGGYTGAWGDQMGRLALLHQKELVLNQEDTANMLSAIEMVRQISSMIDLNAMSASQGLSSLLGYGKINDSKQSLEQNVTIHAEFPGVSDRNEIEEAFNNLINAASQYAHRKI